ncbi:YqaA family protein [Thermogutta sp.]|uniref:YqaA family protein n=1 Tax=Thermogutta sp. TaxID=1962930 RepID=UPI0025EAA33F|nr:YqaA family protein [Thermogutta sp.]
MSLRKTVAESERSVASPPNGGEEKVSASAERPRARRPHFLRRLYDWVLHWADTPYGTPALFLLAVAESSFFPIPPDVLQIALSVARPKRSFYYALVSGVGSVLGGILGYAIGLLLWAAVGGFFMQYVPGFTQENIEYVGRLYEQNAFWAIVCAGFTPIPYKVFTIAAGVFHEYVSLGVLVAGSIIGRFGRFFLVGACLYFFGPSVKSLIERYFDWAALALALLAILGFVAIKWLM